MAARWLTTAQAAELMGASTRGQALRWLKALEAERPGLLRRVNSRRVLVDRKLLEASQGTGPSELERRLDRLEHELDGLHRSVRAVNKSATALARAAAAAQQDGRGLP